MASIEDLKGTITSGISRADRFRVKLPAEFGVDGRTVDTLCRATNIPGRQITTNDRTIGMITQKMPYGFLSEDVNLTFLLDQDYSMRTYFENWQKAIVGFDTYELFYKSGSNGYGKDVIIEQLNHGDGSVVYACKLIKAFPTTMQAIELGDDLQNQIVQLNVQLSYTVWEPA
jgi:hypothetical protein